jgi:hypothetical protein
VSVDRKLDYAKQGTYVNKGQITQHLTSYVLKIISACTAQRWLHLAAQELSAV